MLLLRRLLLLLIPLLLAACGFQLRGEAHLPTEFSPLFIDAEDFPAADRALLRAELERAGATVADGPNGVNRLWIRLQPRELRGVASSSLGSVSLWRIELRLEYGIDDASGAPLRGPRSLDESTRVELDDDNPLTARRRLDQAEWRLRQVLIRRLVFDLQRP